MAIAMPTRNLFNVAHDDITTSTEYERESLDDVVNLSDGHARQPLDPYATGDHRALPGDLSPRPAGVPVPPGVRICSMPSCTWPVSRRSFRRALLPLVFLVIGDRDDRPVLPASPQVGGAHRTDLRQHPEYATSSRRAARGLAGRAAALPRLYRGSPAPHSRRRLDCLSQQPDRARARRADVRRAGRRPASDLGKTLVVDFCFRFYAAELPRWSQYELLQRSGVSFITIEDTGKTWATLDMKIGMLVCSDDLHDEFYHRHDDLLLNVSPFHLALLTEFIDDTIVHGADATIGFYVRQNLEILREAFTDSVLSARRRARVPTVTVAWIRLTPTSAGNGSGTRCGSGTSTFSPAPTSTGTPRQRGGFVRIPAGARSGVMMRRVPIVRSVATALAAGVAA